MKEFTFTYITDVTFEDYETLLQLGFNSTLRNFTKKVYRNKLKYFAFHIRDIPNTFVSYNTTNSNSINKVDQRYKEIKVKDIYTMLKMELI
jgi:hypothetical protein